jgi:hypothetical protein
MRGIDGHEYSFISRDCESNRNVLLEIRPHTGTTHAYLKNVCNKMLQAVKGFYELSSSEPCPGWANWKIVEWSQKDVPERSKFGAWVGDMLAGYVWLRRGFPSHYVTGESLTYIEIMAATPTNISSQIWSRKLAYVGLGLLGFSVLKSQEFGHYGRFSLHAADNTAAEYYRRLNEMYDGDLFENETTGIAGVEPSAEHAKQQPYFETKLEGALRLLGEHRNG